MFSYYVIHKPYGVLSQFTVDHPGQTTLKDLFLFPSDVYPVGRLDKDSEGLLILTNDKRLHSQIINPKFKHQKIYAAQVEGAIRAEDLLAFEKGIQITVNGSVYQCLPAQGNILESVSFEPRNPPIRSRQLIPTSWASIALHEGKNHQVRKMFAAIGFPVLRLIRTHINNLSLEHLDHKPVKQFTKSELYKLLRVS